MWSVVFVMLNYLCLDPLSITSMDYSKVEIAFYIHGTHYMS